MIIRIAVIALGLVASNPLAYFAVELLGRLRWHVRLHPQAAQWYRRFYNLKVDDDAIRRIHSSAMVHKLFYYLDLFAYAVRPTETTARRLKIVGAERFRQLSRSGRPILFLQMHTGSFYSLLPWLAHNWKRINAVFVNQSPLRQAVHDAALAPYLLNRVTTYHAVVAGLRRGESCLIMFDGGKFNPRHAEKMVINGCDLYLPTSAIAIARETGCHVLPVYSERKSWRKTVFHFGSSLELNEESSMARVFDWYLPRLRNDPTQWFALIENLQAAVRIQEIAVPNESRTTDS